MSLQALDNPCFESVSRHPGEVNGNASRRLKKIEIVISPETLSLIKGTLPDLCVGALIMTDVHICERGRQQTDCYRGTRYEVLRSKVKLEVVVSVRHLSDVIELLSTAIQSTSDAVEECLIIHKLEDVEVIQVRVSRAKA